MHAVIKRHDDAGERIRLRAGPLLAALLGAACFANALPNGFTYDDKEIVADNLHIRSLTNLRGLWLSDWWSSKGDRVSTPDPTRDLLYRPLTLHSFAVNYALDAAWRDEAGDNAGADGTGRTSRVANTGESDAAMTAAATGIEAGRPRAFGFHLGNVLLHSACCALVWFLGRRLLASEIAAGAAALVFAVHPVHCEAVANIVGRAEILAALFLMLGMLTLMPARGPAGWARGLAAAACFAAALFSKETAICYPAVAAIALWMRPCDGGPRRRWALHVVTLALPLALYLPLRFAALDGRLMRAAPPHALYNPMAGTDARGRAIGPLTIAGHYARLMLFPRSLCSDYGRAVIDPPRVEAMTGLGVLASLCTFAAPAGARSRRPFRRPLAGVAAMTLASYALISNTAVLAGVSLAERLFYWPSVCICLGFGLAAAWAWRRLAGDTSAGNHETKTGESSSRIALDIRAGVSSRRFAAALLRPVAWLAVAGLLTALAWHTIDRNADWRSDESLALADVATHPDSAMLQAFAARAIMAQAGHLDDACKRRRQLVQADRHLERSLRIAPRNPYALHLRGRARAWLFDFEMAARLLESAVQLNAREAEPREYLEQVRQRLATPAAERIAALEAELRSCPDDAVLHARLGEFLLRAGRFDEAQARLETACRLDAGDIDSQRHLGEALSMLGRREEAIRVLRQAELRDPENWQVLVSLSGVLSASAPAEALRIAERAYRLRPEEFETDANYAEALLLNGRREEALARYRRMLRELPEGCEMREFVTQRIAAIADGGRR